MAAVRKIVVENPQTVYNVTYQQETKRERSEHLVSPDRLTKERRERVL